MNTNYYKLNMFIYWTDFILSLFSFVISFYFVYIKGSIIAFLLACIFLYRVCTFTHEIAHQNKNKKIKLFKFIWNLIGGLLMLSPSIRFTKPHLQHHTVGIFATDKDPQYPLIFKYPSLAFVIFIILPLLLPIYNFIICLIPFKNNWLNKILYKNINFNNKELLEITLWELYYSSIFILLGILNIELLITFYVVSVGAWFLSVLRIPLEHPLNEYKKTSCLKDQEVLSYTHKNLLYVIIQPLGLRFHTLHHMYPKLPYYKLKNFKG